MNYIIKCKPFQDLTILDLYNILKIRQEVFIVEQNCPYLDADGKDFESYHLMLQDTDEHILAYVRLLPEGISYAGYTSIGRVLNHAAVRNTGIGTQLMHEAIKYSKQLFGTRLPIKIGAQSYLLHFYEKFGFKSTGEEYLEDGIPHTKMILFFEK